MPYDGDKRIMVGKGEGLLFKHIGIGTLHNNSHTLHLKNILHVPMLQVNLLSVKQLCKDNNSWFICDDLQFVQEKATGVVLYQGKSNNDELFRIPIHMFPKLLNQGVFLPLLYWEKLLNPHCGISDWGIHLMRF